MGARAAERLHHAHPQVGDARLRNPAHRRAHPRHRRGRAPDQTRRRGRADRELARVVRDGRQPDGVRDDGREIRRMSARRIVVVDENQKSKAVADGPTPDVRTDPARPGFSSARMWVSDATPVPLKDVRETLSKPHTLEPPLRGSVCRVVTFPPDASWRGRVGQKEVQAYFEAMGSPAASTWSPDAPHPYMQKTRTLDFCLVIEGEITLVLD